MRKTSLILLASATLPMAVQAANTEFSYGGYIKMDAMISNYSEGEIASTSSGRDFYVPSATPTGNTGNDSSAFDMGAQTSRINFKTVTTLNSGEKVTTFVEMDFLTGSGNEVVSNSNSPRLRHAFFKHGNYTFGQTWSTFMNTGALLETVDFLGVSDGTVFNRQAQIRYTNGGLQLALENPATTVNGVGNTDDSALPDMIARYNFKAGNAVLSVAGIARNLAYKDEANNIDESIMRFGMNVSGKLMVGKDDLKFSITKGHVARYVGLAMSSDATLTNKGDLVGNNVTAAFIGFRHHWNDSVRSTIGYSMINADNHADAGTAVNKSSKSMRANVMWSPAEKMTYGVELSKATLEKESGVDGDMTRAQFTAKYAF